MKRRTFVSFAIAFPVLRPAFVSAQTVKKRPTVGVLWHAGNAEEERIPLGALLKGLQEAGYVDGQTMRLENRYPNEEPELFKSKAAELAALRPDIIVAVTRQAALAAKQAAPPSTPIFFLSVPDPVESGLVQSLARPGANVTGFSSMAVELIPKRISLVAEAVPGSGIAIIVNGNYENGVKAVRQVRDKAVAQLKMSVETFLVRSPADFLPAYAAIKKTGMRGVVLAQDGLFYANMGQLTKMALDHGLALMAYSAEMTEAGALISYGADIPDYFHRGGHVVARILKGAKPADLPVEQPVRFDLSVNIKTAKALGIKIPDSIMVQATKIVE